jgi:hypothetical protein
MVIWKYPLIIGKNTLTIPVGGEVLSLQIQHDTPHLWVLVNPKHTKVGRIFEFYGTGHSIPEDSNDRTFVDTIQIENGQYVFHLFEIT